MQDIIKHINYKGIEYPIVFNLNVIEKIQNKFGSYEKWGEMTEGKDNEVNIGALKFGITEMMNEGIDIENETATAENKKEFLTEKQVGRIITELGTKKMIEKVQETVIDSTKNENEEEKNV